MHAPHGVCTRGEVEGVVRVKMAEKGPEPVCMQLIRLSETKFGDVSVCGERRRRGKVTGLKSKALQDGPGMPPLSQPLLRRPHVPSLAVFGPDNCFADCRA